MRPIKFKNLLVFLKRNRNIILLFGVMLLMAGTGLAACPLGSDVSNSSCYTCIDFNASPNTICQGQCSTLTLSVSDTRNEASCNFPIGSFSACPGSSYTYTAICSGSGGTVSHSAAVKVTCCVTSWSPDPSTVCSGQSFTQTSNCGDTRTAVGTQPCCTASCGAWGACSVSCGGGTQSRTCTRADCSTYTETQSCNTQSCNNPPSATNLQVTQSDSCLVGWANATFSWTFSDPGDTQSAYRIQVDNNSNFSSPEVDSGKVISSSNSYTTQSGKLSFNTTYYWRLMVWDSTDTASSWISGTSFTTPRHAYPYIDFTWVPQNPTIDESTQFTDQSQVYGGTTKSSWYWTFQNGSPSFSAIQNPLIKFLSTGAKTITLKVTDSDGFNCTGQKTLNTLLRLPDWREIPPF